MHHKKTFEGIFFLLLKTNLSIKALKAAAAAAYHKNVDNKIETEDIHIVVLYTPLKTKSPEEYVP